MVCKKCKVSCKPIGATLRGVQLIACPSCSQVFADMPGVKTMRGGAEAARRSHKPKVVGSSPTPATKSKVQKLTKLVVKKPKVAVKGKNGSTNQKHR